MRAHRFIAPLILAGLAAGCGGSSPSAPSTVTPPTSVSPATTQGIIGATLTQATSVLVSATSDGLSRVITYTCPSGGSITMTMTFNLTPTAPSGTVTSSSRTEFNDCRSESVTIHGDPYLMMTGETVVVRGADLTSSMTVTMRMTGGLRFEAGATQGRAQYRLHARDVFPDRQRGSDAPAVHHVQRDNDVGTAARHRDRAPVRAVGGRPDIR